jgi:hypothetical protein
VVLGIELNKMLNRSLLWLCSLPLLKKLLIVNWPRRITCLRNRLFRMVLFMGVRHVTGMYLPDVLRVGRLFIVAVSTVEVYFENISV